MFNMTKNGLLGFDIGAASVKAAQIVRKDNRYLLRSAAIVSRRERWSAQTFAGSQTASSADEIAAAACLCDRARSGYVGAMLPMALCDVFQIPAPTSKRGMDAEIQRALDSELGRSAAERVVDYWPGRQGERKINVLAAPQAWSDQVSEDLAACGQRCRLIDALPWALTRAACLTESTPNRTLAILDWGYAKATLLLVHEQVPVMVRGLKDSDLQQVIAAVEQQLNVSTADAEALLAREQVFNGEEGAAAGILREIIADQVSRLVEEIRRTLHFWQGSTRLMPEVLYLFGGGASLKGLDRWLTSALNIEARRWTLAPEDPNEGDELPPAHLLGPAVGLSAAAWGQS